MVKTVISGEEQSFVVRLKNTVPVVSAGNTVPVLSAGNAVPVQLDARSSEPAGEAADEAGSVAQRSVTSRLVHITAEDGIISSPHVQ